MPFAKGQSGNPGGKKTEKLITDAIRMALTEEHEATGKKKLRVLAEKLVDEAIEGNVQAMKEVADRMEGKPAQAISADMTGSLTINVVKHGSVDPE